ncbi:MAG TPA: 3'-5' exonuclease, partial [Flavisolibacter sp.]|nr:3'-5' exonuclease [Flavisolibacter sp.]
SELNYKGQKTSLRQWLCEEAARPQIDLFDVGLHYGLKEASQILEGLIKAVSNETVQLLLEKVVREAGFLSHLMNSPEKTRLLQFLSGFYDHVKEETRRHPLLSLEAFMNRIALMQKEGLVLPLVQVSGNERGVNLMTAHGSKGLEFDYVFVVGNSSSCWEKKRKPFSGFSFPDTLFATGAKSNDTEELRRLFYVALTRAKKHLYVSYPRYTNEGKELEATMFLAEIQMEHELPVAPVKLTEDEQTAFSVLQFQNNTAPEVAHLDDDLVDRMVQNFSMSVSSLNAYLKCPLGFYYQTVVRIPSPRNEAMEFGSAVHYALESLFNKMRKNEQFPLLDDFLQDFTWHMKRHRESFTKEQYERRVEYGREI